MWVQLRWNNNNSCTALLEPYAAGRGNVITGAVLVAVYVVAI